LPILPISEVSAWRRLPILPECGATRTSADIVESGCEGRREAGLEGLAALPALCVRSRWTSAPAPRLMGKGRPIGWKLPILPETGFRRRWVFQDEESREGETEWGDDRHVRFCNIHASAQGEVRECRGVVTWGEGSNWTITCRCGQNGHKRTWGKGEACGSRNSRSNVLIIADGRKRYDVRRREPILALLVT
jgi:hypothetical protein